jgi:hypothetical protein
MMNQFYVSVNTEYYKWKYKTIAYLCLKEDEMQFYGTIVSVLNDYVKETETTT